MTLVVVVDGVKDVEPPLLSMAVTFNNPYVFKTAIADDVLDNRTLTFSTCSCIIKVTNKFADISCWHSYHLFFSNLIVCDFSKTSSCIGELPI